MNVSSMNTITEALDAYKLGSATVAGSNAGCNNTNYYPWAVYPNNYYQFNYNDASKLLAVKAIVKLSICAADKLEAIEGILK